MIINPHPRFIQYYATSPTGFLSFFFFIFVYFRDAKTLSTTFFSCYLPTCSCLQPGNSHFKQYSQQEKHSNFVFVKRGDDCGTGYGCFSAPANCMNQTNPDSSSCEFIYKFKTSQNDGNVIDFILTAKVRNPNSAYLAIGFAYEEKMVSARFWIYNAKYPFVECFSLFSNLSQTQAS